SKGLVRIEKDLSKTIGKNKNSKNEKLKGKIDSLIESVQQGVFYKNLENYFSFFYPERNTVLDYIDSAALIVLDEPSRIRESFENWEQGFMEQFKSLLEDREVLPEQS